MIWMGEEFADYHGKAMDPQKIDWTLLKNERNQQLHAHYKKLIHLRRGHKALHTNNLDFIFEHAEDGILTYVRWDDAGNKVLVIANLRDRAHEGYALGNLPDGKWKDVLSDEEITIENHALTTPLHPWQARVFVSV
jgi:1,4-alpha-glucan branching enzyme